VQSHRQRQRSFVCLILELGSFDLLSEQFHQGSLGDSTHSCEHILEVLSWSHGGCFRAMLGGAFRWNPWAIRSLNIQLCWGSRMLCHNCRSYDTGSSPFKVDVWSYNRLCLKFILQGAQFKVHVNLVILVRTLGLFGFLILFHFWVLSRVVQQRTLVLKILLCSYLFRRHWAIYCLSLLNHFPNTSHKIKTN